MATAPDLAPAKQMGKYLECSLCLETLKEPRTLGCFHSFCKHCLAKYVEAQRGEEPVARAKHLFHCPLCRTQFELGEGKRVEQLPTNHFINNMLEILAIQQQADKLPCESCKAQYPAHNNWPDFEDHVVLTLEELAKPENQAKARGKPRCKKKGHGNKHLEFYCYTCEELACINCIVLDHSKANHDYQPVDAVAAQHKEALKDTFAILLKKAEQGQNAVKEIECTSQNAEARAKKAKDAILQQEREVLKEFTAKLKRQTAVLLGEVNQKYNDINQKLLKQQNEMKGYVEKVNGSLGFAQNIIEKGSNEEILSLGGEIKENYSAFEKECPKLMTAVHTDDFEYLPSQSTKSILETVNLNDLGKIVNGQALQLLCETSTILQGNINHVQQLVRWVEDEKFSWTLCYRASRDGWDSDDFHRKCDEVGPTMTLVKCGTNIFGGYTDQSWKPPLDYKPSDASFLFSLENKDRLPPFKCPIYDHKKDRAIFCHPRCGAVFGDGPDLFISPNANTNQYSYSNLGDTYQPPPGYQPDTPQTQSLLADSCEFKPTEIEVFHG